MNYINEENFIRTDTYSWLFFYNDWVRVSNKEDEREAYKPFDGLALALATYYAVIFLA